MKRIFLILTCMCCLLLSCCSINSTELDFGTYYCAELDCYIEVCSTPFYQGWFFDYAGNRQELDIYINRGDNMVLRHVCYDYGEDDKTVTRPWLTASVKNVSSDQFTLKYSSSQNDSGFFELDMKSKDENGDKKFVFNRINE